MTVPVVLPVDPLAPEPAVIARAASVLCNGGLVVFPTETVYGLGANALDRTAVARIFAVKGRPTNNPLIIHVESIPQATMLTRRWTSLTEKLVNVFWPGPLTLVLPRSRQVPVEVTGGGDTVAIRWPIHPVARALITMAGCPIAAPSANRSTELSPTCAEHVLRGLAEGYDLLLDGGPTTGGLESTVLDMTTDPPRLLRPGLISPSEIADQIGPIERVDLTNRDQTRNPLPSPGMMTKHYSPRTPLICVDSEDEAKYLVVGHVQQGRRVGLLTWNANVEHSMPGVIAIEMPRDVAGYALKLYAYLHDLDSAVVDVIVVTLPPNEDEWLAVRDRLQRAAAK